MSPPRDFVQQQWDDHFPGLARLKVGEASQSWSSSHFCLEGGTGACRRDTN